jgi:DNA-binding GntR family transcriptional regulator
MSVRLKEVSQIEEVDVADLGSSGRNLRDLAYDRILDMLLSGELVAGTLLQERRLADVLKISRTPVREALGQLESEGLVTRPHGRLMMVCQISIQSYIEILNVRKLLEVDAAGLAAGKISKATAESMRSAIWALMEENNPTPGQHWAVDDLVHSTIADASESKLLATLIRDLRRRTHIFNTRRIPSRLRPGALEHLALIDAVAAGDPGKARSLMAEHLENVKAAIVQELVSTANRQGA